MAFTLDKGKVIDADRNIIIRPGSPIKQAVSVLSTGSVIGLPYVYQNGNLEFDFYLAQRYVKNPKTGRKLPIATYIKERHLRKTINDALSKAGQPELTDEQYTRIKEYLRDAIRISSIYHLPPYNVPVSFIDDQRQIDEGHSVS